MRKQRFITFALATVLVLASIPTAWAARSTSAKLPAFTVTLNGSEIDSKQSQYPLIVYKDITYFPMTYYYARFLGLETGWADNTLTISKTSDSLAYEDWYHQKTANKTSYPVAIADCKIVVNGKTIDNSKEEYPLLQFRDVTYFPLTWRFAVEEFGWAYTFDDASGLSISSGNGGSMPNVPTKDEMGEWSKNLSKFNTTTVTVNGHSVEKGNIGNADSQSPNRYDTAYIYTQGITVVFPSSTFDERYTFTYQKGVEKEISFSLEDPLTGADWYLNTQLDAKGITIPDSGIEPYIDAGVLYLPCCRMLSGTYENFMLHISLDEGKILKMDPLSPG